MKASAIISILLLIELLRMILLLLLARERIFFLVRDNILFFIKERGRELQRYIWDTMKLLGDTASFVSFLFWENLWELVQNKT